MKTQTINTAIFLAFAVLLAWLLTSCQTNTGGAEGAPVTAQPYVGTRIAIGVEVPIGTHVPGLGITYRKQHDPDQPPPPAPVEPPITYPTSDK